MKSYASKILTALTALSLTVPQMQAFQVNAAAAKQAPAAVAIASAGNWSKNYASASTGHFVVFGDVAGAPGEEVEVPLYVYGDVGTAGIQLCIGYDKALTMTDLAEAPTNEVTAYVAQYMINPDIYPATVVAVDSKDNVAKDGNIIVVASFKIPENATPGQNFKITFEDCTEPDESGSILKNQFINYNGTTLDVKKLAGSITVVKQNEVTLSKTSHQFASAGEVLSLNLFNASGDVTWKSSDEKVATVDANGFVKSVGSGSAVITASCGGKDYTCNVSVNVFGDVNKDGSVALVDALTVLQAYTTNTLYNQPMPLNDEEYAIADVDGDGKISLTDALSILQYYTRTTLYHEQNVSWYEITKNPNAPGAP